MLLHFISISLLKNEKNNNPAVFPKINQPHLIPLNVFFFRQNEFFKPQFFDINLLNPILLRIPFDASVTWITMTDKFIIFQDTFFKIKNLYKRH